MAFSQEIPVVFLGTQRTSTSENLIPHTHDYYELNYLTRGKGQMKTNDLVSPYEAYDVILVPPKTWHNLYTGKDELCRNYSVWFTGAPDFMSGFVKEHQIIKFHDYDGSVHFLVSEVFRLYNSYGMQNAEFYNAYLYTALLYMRKGDVMETLVVNELDDDPIERAVRYINDNVLVQPVTVSTVASMLGLSPAYFARMFLKRIGIAPMKYIIEVKMNYAKKILAEKDLSIKEIAAELHYEDQLYFSRQFARATGLSPRQYRTEARK